METRRIVIIGGCGLAFGASFANTGLVLTTGTSVSYLTGDISKLSVDLAQFDPSILTDSLKVGTAALSFFLGAMLAGILICHPTLDLSRPYGRTVTGIGVLFIVGSLMTTRIPILGIGLAALACGIQNSLAAHYRGMVLRTTHLTGLMTDFGVTVGMRLRGHHIPLWKIAVPFLLIASFFAGGVCAGLVHFAMSANTTLVAGIAYCLAGLGWTAWKHSRFFAVLDGQ